ncbi:hypothetical protein HanIR_Chr03g0141021 [Helianthus annuus]|nr:hypothetical protein HanIR_Chr03g0141021 [Helianthus annuus]
MFNRFKICLFTCFSFITFLNRKLGFNSIIHRYSKSSIRWTLFIYYITSTSSLIRIVQVCSIRFFLMPDQLFVFLASNSGG